MKLSVPQTTTEKKFWDQYRKKKKKTFKLMAHNDQNMPDDKNMAISQIRIFFICYSLIQYTEAEIYCLF
jgi:hypothetical protein